MNLEGRPIAWIPRSSDLSPLDPFLWGYVKDVVYQAKVQDMDKLLHRLTAACETVIPVKLQNTWRQLEYRQNIRRAIEGSHVELY
jgi:hypothetical protein